MEKGYGYRNQNSSYRYVRMRSLKSSPSTTSTNSKEFCENILKFPKATMKNTWVGLKAILLNVLELLHPPEEDMAWVTPDEYLRRITNAKMSLMLSLISNRECLKEKMEEGKI